MIFGILIIAFILAIGFFHYIQGFFSATLSAIFVVIAAVVAFSYHELIVEKVLGGKFPDESHAIVLLLLFAAIYLALRLVFDAAVPGNVRVPLIADKVGAAVMGLIAGIFATGVLAVAAQELPFGPGIAGFARYDLTPDRSVKVPTTTRAFMSKLFDQVATKDSDVGTDHPFGEVPHGVPIIPVDNILVGTVEKLSSASGSLQNGKPLDSLHPDFLDEAFGQRLGIEPGGSHVAVNPPDGRGGIVSVTGLYALNPEVPEADPELPDVRNNVPFKPVRPKSNQMFLVVRTMFASSPDADSVFRFSPGACRLLVEQSKPGADTQTVNYYPIGTLEAGKRLYVNKIDDYLFVDVKGQARGADLVFLVDKALFDKQAPDGAMLEVKREGRVDLSGEKVNPTIKPDPQVEVLRKALVLHPDEAPGGAQPPPAAQPAKPAPSASATPAPSGSSSSASAAGSAFNVTSASASTALPVPIPAPAGAQNGALASVPGGSVALQDGKLKSGELDSSRAQLTGGQPITQFAVPAGQAMVQVVGAPPRSTPWGFATEPEQYELVDSQGKHYQPNGIFAEYKGAGGDRVKLRYIAATTISGTAAPEGGAEPGQVTLLYVVPANASITEFDDHGQKAHAMSVVAK